MQTLIAIEPSKSVRGRKTDLTFFTPELAPKAPPTADPYADQK